MESVVLSVTSVKLFVDLAAAVVLQDILLLVAKPVVLFALQVKHPILVVIVVLVRVDNIPTLPEVHNVRNVQLDYTREIRIQYHVPLVQVANIVLQAPFYVVPVPRVNIRRGA